MSDHRLYARPIHHVFLLGQATVDLCVSLIVQWRNRALFISQTFPPKSPCMTRQAHPLSHVGAQDRFHLFTWVCPICVVIRLIFLLGITDVGLQ